MIPGGSCRVEFAGETLDLLPQRAAWWGAERTLLLADLHLGKPASFRAQGAPVPESVTASDLERLGGLVRALQPAHVVVLGDLAHDRAAWRKATLASFGAWRAAHGGLELVLVRGNHDRWASDPPAGLGITAVEPGWTLGGITLCHDPAEAGEGPSLCGHLHPGIALTGRRRTGGLRAPCFWFSPRLGVLPAFGSFTGLAMISPRAGDRVFAVGERSVLEVGEAARA